jgi:hypothetical protein
MLYIENKMKLLRIIPAEREDKKYTAVFEVDGRERRVSFGAAGMSDYTKNKDPERKRLYLARHAARENWNDPMTPGALSRWILWNEPTLEASIRDYRRRFNL